MSKDGSYVDRIKAELAANPELAAGVAQALLNAHIAQQVYDLRIAAQLTQKQLAEKIGTRQSVISRIEDADYEGHSLKILQRIGAALGKKLRVEFYDEKSEESPAITTSAIIGTIGDYKYDFVATHYGPIDLSFAGPAENPRACISGNKSFSIPALGYRKVS